MRSYTQELMEQNDILSADRDRWRKATEELWLFIRDHVRAVGHEEVDAYYRAKSFYDEAQLAQ